MYDMEEKDATEVVFGKVKRRRSRHRLPKISETKKPYMTLKDVIKDMPWGFEFRPKKVVTKSPRTSNRKRKGRMISNLCHQVDFTSSVMERAREVQAKLNPKFPSFVKPMIHSNVSSGFWLSLPRLFCDLHLPRDDTNLVLVDESQREYKTNYLYDRRGLSGGWRAFSLAHNLVEGDILVFHLVKVCRMKVYIVRAKYLAEVDAALSLLNLEACANEMHYEHQVQNSNDLNSARHLEKFDPDSDS